jgi:hypothetical protein
VAYLGRPHMCLLHALSCSSYYIWSISLEGVLVETLLAIYGGIYFIIVDILM